jgi:hypothetical protein
MSSMPLPTNSATSPEENREPDIPTTSIPIRQEVTQIIQEKQNDVMETIRTRHEAFCIKYPKFFDKLMEDPIDWQQLGYILNMYESVKDGHQTATDASKTVGQKMFDQYVAPTLPETPPATPSDQTRGAGGIQFGVKPAGTSSS